MYRHHIRHRCVLALMVLLLMAMTGSTLVRLVVSKKKTFNLIGRDPWFESSGLW